VPDRVGSRESGVDRVEVGAARSERVVGKRSEREAERSGNVNREVEGKRRVACARLTTFILDRPLAAPERG